MFSKVKETIIRADIRIFYFINKGLKNPFFDLVMPVITNEHYFRVILLLITVLLLIFGDSLIRTILILALVVVTLADQISNLIKNRVRRIRPIHNLPGVNKLISAGRLSFPSNHSANNLGAAVLVTFFSVEFGVAFIGLALVIGFSRIYCGVHYPLDVLTGFLIGVFSAIAVFMTYSHFFIR